MNAQPTVPVRITAKRYNLIRRDAKSQSTSITWLLNYIIDLYYQGKGIDSLTGKPLIRQESAKP